MKEKVCAIIGTIITNVFLTAAIASIAYNNFIAWEFNLPQFSYWAFVLFRVAYLFWINKSNLDVKFGKE